MKQLFVVWHGKGKEWKPTKPMTKEQADMFAQNLVANGYMVKVFPKLVVTVDDMIEG
ncbi:hypothetical protein LLE49_09805 [Alicyclobacillus tolerans]|uniref:hypothetical protein n=1 Tax=Alicyclobacillus tolerans TaxID=90970 RepID=UPI001F43937A|nr:hypothetical protein [Alicyclobacillus tolerans]MCF8565010.1 hypothetical protein [Alicyclobacillus tolerans]